MSNLNEQQDSFFYETGASHEENSAEILDLHSETASGDLILSDDARAIQASEALAVVYDILDGKDGGVGTEAEVIEFPVKTAGSPEQISPFADTSEIAAALASVYELYVNPN